MEIYQCFSRSQKRDSATEQLRTFLLAGSVYWMDRFSPPQKLLALVVTGFMVLTSTLAGELRALCSAAADLVRAAKAQEDTLIANPTANELAASTMVYAAAKKRYVAELRSVMSIVIAIGLKQRPENAEIEEFRSVFQQFGGNEEERVARATLGMLRRFANQPAVATAEKEFAEAQETEAALLREYDGLNAASAN